MAVCNHCDGEMTEVNQCKEGIDPAASAEAIRLRQSKVQNCHDCRVAPGATHHPGCDTERCARCGGQAIGCNCVFEVNGYDMNTLEEKHPELYNEGPTDEMYEKWDAEWGDKRVRYTGLSPGSVECIKLGWFCRDLDTKGRVVNIREALDIQSAGGRVLWHQPCKPDDEGASPNLNRWASAGCPTGAALEALIGRVSS